MLDVLFKIWCGISSVPWHIADLGVGVLNGLMAWTAALVIGALALLPAMPELPGSIAHDVLNWANWLMPLGALLAMFAVYLGLYVAVRLIIATIRLADRVGVLDSGRR